MKKNGGTDSFGRACLEPVDLSGGSRTRKNAAVSLKRISEKLNYPKYVLSFSHSDYLVSLGGTEKVLHEEQALLFERKISYIQVYALEKGERPGVTDTPDQLIGVNVDSIPVGRMTALQLGVCLNAIGMAKRLVPAAVHIHHLMHFSLPALTYLIRSVQPLRARYFVHDYYAVCTNHNLLRDGLEYCGHNAADTEYCLECRYYGDRKKHYSAVRHFIGDIAPEIIAPSETAADIWKRYYGDLGNRIRIVPHQLFSPAGVDAHYDRALSSDREERKPAVAYLGYESPIKGLDTWWRLSRDDQLKQRYRFFHLGAAGVRVPGVTYVPVSFIEDGPDAMVTALKENGIDVAFLWSISPETYSFTLSEAFSANCLVLTTECSGNIAARVRETGRGIVLKSETEMFALLHRSDKIKHLIAEHRRRHQALTLSFNPQIAEETAALEISPSRTAMDLEGHGEGEMDVPVSWLYLMRLLDGDGGVAREDVTALKLRIEALRKELSVCRQSLLHRAAESLRRTIGRFPNVSGRFRHWFVSPFRSRRKG